MANQSAIELPTVQVVGEIINPVPQPGPLPALYYPEDYILQDLIILSSTAPGLDIRLLMIELDYYEDIFSNFVSGHLIVKDSGGIFEALNMSGNEYIKCTFGKSNDRAVQIEKVFRIYKVSNKQLVDNMQSEGYIIHFCSDELVLSEQYRIQKSYKGQKISVIIDDILKTYLKVPSSNYFIEDTQGLYDFVIPNFKPFKAINWLANYAQSASPTSIGADMLFFEDKDGFNFVSLQSLFNDTPERTYFYDPKNTVINNSLVQNTAQERKYFNVISYEIIRTFDSLEGIHSGTFANRLIAIDPMLRKVTVTDFNYDTYFNNANKLNTNKIINNTVNRLNDTVSQTPAAKLNIAITNANHINNPYIGSKQGSVSKDFGVETYLPNRIAQLALTNYNKVRLTVPGDPVAKVGTCIAFNLTSMYPSDMFNAASKNLDEFYSGKYLISAVKHTMTLKRYQSTIEIIKDSTTTAYADPDSTSTLWKSATAGTS